MTPAQLADAISWGGSYNALCGMTHQKIKVRRVGR